MAERQLPKLHTRVRFPSPAPNPFCRTTRAFRCGQSHIALCWSLDRVGAASTGRSSTLRSLTSSVFVHSGYCRRWSSSRCYKKKSPHCGGLFCITSLGIRLRRSRRLHSARHNHNRRHNRHSKAAERSRSFHNTAERNRSFYNTAGSDDSRNGGNDASVDGAS